mgnify:CR=1 FL=1
MLIDTKRTAAGLIGATALLLATAAHAQDGLRVGLFAQGVFADAKVVEITPAVAPPPPPPPPIEDTDGSASLDSFGGGVSLGYDFKLGGPWRLGIEGDFSLARADTTYNGNNYGTDWLATLRARAGYNVTPRLLVYLTGGAAWLDADYSGAAAPPAPAPVQNNSKLLNGWTIGGGGELTSGAMTYFAEYLYADFETWRFSKGAELYIVDADAHIVRAGVKLKLGN